MAVSQLKSSAEERDRLQELPFACVIHTLAENEAYVDTNNCPWVVNFLETKGLAKSTGRMRRSGYCTYPAMKFDREKMEEFEGGC